MFDQRLAMKKCERRGREGVRTVHDLTMKMAQGFVSALSFGPNSEIIPHRSRWLVRLESTTGDNHSDPNSLSSAIGLVAKTRRDRLRHMLDRQGYRKKSFVDEARAVLNPQGAFDSAGRPLDDLVEQDHGFLVRDDELDRWKITHLVGFGRSGNSPFVSRIEYPRPAP